MRRTRGPDDGSVAVELVEVGNDIDASDTLAGRAGSGRGPAGMPDDAPDDAPTEPPARRRRALWWVGAGVIAALVVAVVSVNVVEARREAARRAALAELPWVLPHLSGPLEEVWRAPGGIVLAETANRLVMLDYANGSLAAVDAASGAVAWERVSHDDSCNGFIDPARWTERTASGVVPEPDLLICVPNTVDTLAGATDGAPASAVELLDVATGQVVTSIPIVGSLIGTNAVGDDVVLTSVLPDASVQVVRVVGRTGEPVWTYRSEPAVVAVDSFAWAYVVDGVVLIQADRIVAVSTETGREVPVPDGELVDGTFIADSVADGAAGEAVIPLPDGAEIRFRYEPTTGRPEAGRVVEADGSTRFTFEGGPWLQGRSDGSVPGVLVVQQDDTTEDADYQGRLVGLDVATGDERWSVPDVFSQRLLQIDGLALATGVKNSVIDVRTGRVLWEHPVSDEIASVALTDGDTVLLPRRGAGGEGLVAVDLRTGAESWWMPVDGGAYDLRVRDDGLVLLLTESEIVAYR